MEEAGSKGNYVPSSEVNTTNDLLRTVTLNENVINHAVRQFCDRCSTLISICGQFSQYTDYQMNERIATCLFLDAESSRLSVL